MSFRVSALDRDRASLLQERLGYDFKDISILTEALTHSSFVNENAGAVSNERMEFLGDSILSFVSTQYLYANFPQNEGQLSRMRSVLVSGKSLCKIAEEYGVQNVMRLGVSLKNKLIQTGSVSQSIVADCVEALIAAVFLDGGYEAARAVVMRMLSFLIDSADVLEDSEEKDYKTLLQELVQKKLRKLPEYESVRIARSSSSSLDLFEVSLSINGEFICSNRSSSIREAQRLCAKEAYLRITDGDSPSQPI